MKVQAHAITNLFYNSLPNLYWGTNRLMFHVRRLNKRGTLDTSILLNVITFTDLANNPDEYPVVIDGRHVKITKHNEDFTQFTMSFEPYVPPATPRYRPDTLYADLIEGKSLQSALLLNAKDRYTVLFFSGSWCVPCQQAMPTVKKFYQRYGQQVNFKSILAEASPAAALRYAAKGKWPWPSHYIPMGNNAPGSLQQLFKVGAYPSFVLIDKKRQWIATYSAAEGLAELEGRLKQLIAIDKAGY